MFIHYFSQFHPYLTLKPTKKLSQLAKLQKCKMMKLSSGLAMAATLTLNSIPYVLLERDDCYAPLWKKSSYDGLHLHLPKHFCQLPHMSFPPSSPKYVPKDMFLTCLEDYVSNFKINPMYRRSVLSAKFDEVSRKWKMTVKYVGENEAEEEEEEYARKLLVVATRETSDVFVPDIEGSERFNAEVLHTTEYKNGKGYNDKSVLVVGSGNSGMEIALDLANHGAKTSIVIRSPIHIITREMDHMGLFLFNYLLFKFVESLLVLSKLKYGNLTKYGIERPEEGPFHMKEKYGKYPVSRKITSGEIQVLPALARIKGNEVESEDEKSCSFDVIIFATGFKRSTNKWLQEGDDNNLLNEDGLPKHNFPNHWKGKNNLYCIGLARRGFYSISMDARNIADDIKSLLC